LKHTLWEFNQISSYALQRGTGREAPEGTSGLTFFATFFVQRQRKYIKSRHRSARAKKQLPKGRIFQSKILLARVSQAFP
jgi:hypothetical protein